MSVTFSSPQTGEAESQIPITFTQEVIIKSYTIHSLTHSLQPFTHGNERPAKWHFYASLCMCESLLKGVGSETSCVVGRDDQFCRYNQQLPPKNRACSQGGWLHGLTPRHGNRNGPIDWPTSVRGAAEFPGLVSVQRQTKTPKMSERASR
ncbi:unnamed protein product [Protopolystoma xenopodis]|uniref:Uncharacterized protein n=1 Tax=Protopolystoma xenopodis TaxID=117903 RepID=A0A3S5B8A3_9PLAT|nr:unnamed protein product [Protopolystoma xenopodis]